MVEAIKCRIGGFIETTLLDWEGHIASEVFFQGCNFCCPFCHNSHLVGASNLAETIAWETVFEYLKKQKGWVDGVIFSGGEPSICPDLFDLAREVKSLGMKVKLDTNGSHPEIIKEMHEKELLDAVSMDIKASFSNGLYRRAAGKDVDLKAIGQSIEYLVGSGLDFEFRTTVCPSVVAMDDLTTIALFLFGVVSKAGVTKTVKYVLQPFKPANCLDKKLNDLKAYPLITLKDKAEEIVQTTNGLINCYVRGE